ncbi:hypothetical protein P691DRAFT_801062 [Macrolepiota fuliginosa MF-IS2]|uniref:Pentacotripeptide-repeat region of PRORP domain-containing protein n=1 Tax=Macrolepiota fuliginosa MF-IS2 TaxID=1400762 RepID=A0A9P6C4G4_9AGAR|nr:hypothetical protein P691DRAFT_801062 [Macrolepiota fuliginosa MF-IS2]
MVEPLAAVIRNSLFPSRFALQGTSSTLATVKAMHYQQHQSFFSSNTLSPLPRQTKGKEREIMEPRFYRILQCKEWSCCSPKHLLCCPNHSLSFMLQELLPHRERPVRRFQSTRAPLTSRKHRTRFSIGAQQRHASHTTQSAPSSSLPDQPEASTSTLAWSQRQHAIKRISTLAEAPLDKFKLRDAWGAMEIVFADPECYSALDKDILLQFSRKFCDKVEEFYDDASQVEQLKKWREHFRTLVEWLKGELPPTLATQQHHALGFLTARSRALHNQTEAAIEILKKIRATWRENWLDPEIDHTYQSIYASIFYFNDAVHVVQFLDQHFFYEYFRPPYCFFYRDPAEPTSIQSRYHHLLYILSTIRNPTSFFTKDHDKHSRDWRTIGQLLILAYCEHKLPQLALRVYEALQHLKDPWEDMLKLRLVRALARGGSFDEAYRIYATVPETASEYTRTGMHLFALQGDAQRAYSFYWKHKKNASNHSNRVMMLFSHAIQGMTANVRDLFEETYPKDSEGRYTGFQPDVMDYAVATFAHARRSDPEGIEYWLNRMNEDGIKPNLHVYSSIIESYMQSGNLRVISDVLDQMRATGLYPNTVVYTNIITALGRHHTPDTAEAIFKRALRENVKPDIAMVGALMNCYVEAGSWNEVVELFKSLDSNHKTPIQINIELYNMVLKAYVLMGAPFRVVALLFEKLDNDPNVSPTDITFALLLQSACDAGYMSAAMDIFKEMDKRAGRGAKSLVNPFVFTILMSGFLRKGDKEQAMAVYEDMLSRGILPTAITFNTVLSYYSNEQNVDSLRIAHEFMTHATRQEEDVPVMAEHNLQQSPVQAVYEPVLRGYAANGDVEGFERLLNELLNSGGQLTITVLTALLELYQKKDRPESAKKVWDHLLEIGQEMLESVKFVMKGQPDANPPHIDALCVPLTIYLDLLSQRGEHEQVLQVWQDYQKKGFSFNFYSWNKLGVFLIRAGHYERAFEVLDRIIMPYSRIVIARQELVRKIDPERIFIPPFEILNETDLSFLRTVIVPDRPLSSSKRSRLMKRRMIRDPDDALLTSIAFTPLSTSHSSSSPDSTSSSSQFDTPTTSPDTSVPEFVRPLKALASASGSPAVPRPQFALMQNLLFAYQRMRAGQPAIPSVDPGALGDLYYSDYTPEQQAETQRKLEDIHKQFPGAVRAVLEFQASERAHLNENYQKVYIWG